jgi:hypothetical protein
MLVAKVYSTHPGTSHQVCQAHFDYIAFRSSLDCCAGLSLPRGGAM